MKLLTVKEVSEIINAKPSTIYAWAESGTLPCYKIGGLLRFSEDDIMASIKSSKKDPLQQYNMTADERPKKGV